MDDARIVALLEPVLASYALELEEIDVRPAGKRRVVRVVVDGDGPRGRGPLLDDIAAATRAISDALDGDDVTGAAPYTLEVTSRGVSRPLELPRHWRRNRTRLVLVTLTGGSQFTGRVVGSDEQGVRLDVEGIERTLGYAEIGRAVVQVELNRRADDDEQDEQDDDLGDEDEED